LYNRAAPEGCQNIFPSVNLFWLLPAGNGWLQGPVNLFFTDWHGHPRQLSKLASKLFDKRWHKGNDDSQTKRNDDTSGLFHNWVCISLASKREGSNAMRNKTTHLW
jgi:hypothetical protein